jgi:hypothetical protein
VSLLSACAGAGRVVFDASAVPSPPSYSADFKRSLAAEIDAAPRADVIVEALTDASQYYDRIRRLKNPKRETSK